MSRGNRQTWQGSGREKSPADNARLDGVKAFRQQDVARRDASGRPQNFDKQLALHIDVLDVLRIFRWLDRRNDFVESDFDGAIITVFGP